MTPNQIEETLKILGKDKEALKNVKNALVKAKCYELASEVRKLEKEKFPETDEQKEAKAEGEKLNLLFRMVELDVHPKSAYLIAKTLKKYNRRKGNFDLRDASKIVGDVNKLFG